jgi:hypothetical protein
MRRRGSSLLILAFALPTALSTRNAAAQTAPPPAAAPAQPAAPPPSNAPVAPAAPAPTAPAPADTAAPAAPADPAAMPAPVETTVPAPVETAPAAAAPPATVVATPSPTPLPEAPLPRIGVTLGIISLPRPISIEASFRVLDHLGVAAQYSMLPDLQTPGGEAKLQLRAFQGVARYFPFGGSFFIGGGLGYQTFKASLTSEVMGSSLTTTADLSGMFVSPQLGWLLVWHSGFALGITIGAQVPIPKDPVATTMYNGQKVGDMPSAGVPQEVVDRAKSNQDTVETVGKFINKYPFPNIDLLRLGFFF